jgi:hypothetical protein
MKEKARILIVAKTRMQNQKCCVGALTNDGQSVRLLTADGKNNPLNSEFQVGQVWEIIYEKKNIIKPPHVEDILVYEKKLCKENFPMHSLKKTLNQLHVPVCEGNPAMLFEEKLNWTQAGSGFIRRGMLPSNSVGFWISDQPLYMLMKNNNNVRYLYENASGIFSMKYVGLDPPLRIIEPGTLIRISLSRWWKKQDEEEEGCFLQISGWYNDNPVSNELLHDSVF